MTTYKKTERRQWRHALKRFQRRLNYALALLALLAAILMQPAPARADACGQGWTRISHGCRAANMRTVRCDTGYEGRFSKVNGRWVGRCAPGPVVQGG